MSPHLVNPESLPINSTIQQSESGNDDAITTDAMEELLGNTPSDSTTVNGRDDNAMEWSNEIGDAIDGGSAYDTDNVRMAKDASHDAVVRFEEEHNDDGEERKVGTSNDSIGVENGGVNEGSSIHSRGINAMTANRSKYSSAINTEGGGKDEVCPSVIDSSWNATASKRTRNQKQDEFVKNGARIKAILTSALRAVVEGVTSNSVAETRGGNVVGTDSERGALNDVDGTSQKKGQTKTNYANAVELAHEKTEECMVLKRKVQEAQSMIEILQGENSASQNATNTLKLKIERTLDALRIADTNADNARAEADASNARVESLTCQMNDMQSLIDETKRGMEVVRNEHDEIHRASRSMEGRLIQVESELTTARKVKNDAVAERDSLKSRADESEKLVKTLQDEVDDYRAEIRMLKRDLLEMEEFEKVRAERTRGVETELKVARAGLLEASSAAAEAESTVTSLRSVVEELRSENECLHDQMNTLRDGHGKDRAKQNEALIVAEREAQKWKLKCEEGDEEIRKLTMDKETSAKEVATLKSRVANMERRLNDSSKQFSFLDSASSTSALTSSSSATSSSASSSSASSSATPHTSSNLGFIDSLASKPVVTDETKKRKTVAELPMRESVKTHLTYSYPKENVVSTANMSDKRHQRSESFGSHSAAPAQKVSKFTNPCSLCKKDGGLMLKCQCGGMSCDYRAHAICIGNFRTTEKIDSGPTILCNRK
jgi:hypothetical protein